MPARLRVLIVALFSMGLSACGDPLSPFTLEAAFALPAGAEVPVGPVGAPTTWVIADTLRFFTDGTGEQRGTLETRLGPITRQPTARSFRWERTGPQLAVTWLLPCSPACDVVLSTTFYALDADELRGEIGSEAVLYNRMSSARAP